MSETHTQNPTSVVLPTDMKQALAAAARENERSMAAEIRLALREYLATTKERNGRGSAD